MSALSIEPIVARRQPEVARVARPASRRALPRRGGVVAGCSRRPAGVVAPRPRAVLLARLQTLLFVALVVVGCLVAAPKLLAMAQPDPYVDPVPGDPAWVHVAER